MTSKDPADLGVEVLFSPANPLSQSKPPIPGFAPGVRVIPAGSVHGEDAMPVPIDIEVYEDVAIPMRDGVTLYGDVYRKAGVGPVPAILVYTPYTKRGGHFNENFNITRTGVPAGSMSGLQPFEAIDPAYWCGHDYAVVVVDARGTGHSEGDLVFFGTASGRNVHDVIEWIAAREWSTGRVSMAGNSQLAAIQWSAAAERPPHLTAIAPWEGQTDIYADVIARGGIPDTVFHQIDIVHFLYGKGRFEDVPKMIEKYPTKNAYWRDKVADLSVVDIPAYVVASWTHPIHTKTTLAAFEQLASKRKWLRVHNTHEWPDLADPENVEDLRRFFDHYMKDIDNGWETTPRVRYSVLDPGGEDRFRSSDVWPLVNVTPKTFYLDSVNGTLTKETPEKTASVSFDATDPNASAKFTYTAEEETHLHGPLNVRLSIETSAGNDFDVFASLYKTDAKGEVRFHVVFPAMKETFLQLAASGVLPAGPVYVGPNGRIRASHRALDPEKSTDLEPYLTHAGQEFVEPGTPVELDLGLWPTSMLIHPGETLVLEIAGDIAGPLKGARASDEQPDVKLTTCNVGTQTIHTGGPHGSRLFLPIVTG